MRSQEMTGRRYQILQVATRLTEHVKEGLPKNILYLENADGRGLLYADPEELYGALPELDYFGVRGAVLPDYVLAALVVDCTSLGFAVTDIEFADSRVLIKSLIKELINSERRGELRACLGEARTPITAIVLACEEFEVKLYGSGLVTVRGPKEEFEYRIQDILSRLTDYLLTALKKVDSNKESGESVPRRSAKVPGIVMAAQKLIS